MLESFNTKNELQYHKLSPEEQTQRGILGRLVGIIASFTDPTRNGRRYTEDLWDKTFENPIMKEKIQNRCLFGELGHPADRSEVDMEKIAICMAEVPKKGNDGKLHGVFDILDTPNGRILKTLCDYGCKIGVSSRGQGDTFTDYNGQETVDSDTFECECWDAVLLPAVKEARLSYVTESLNTKKTLKQALQESLDNASEEDKKIMSETLADLDIDCGSDENKADEVVESEQPEADNVGNDLVTELQESLKKIQTLQKQVLELQEKLSVSYTKEVKLEESNNELKSSVKQLTESVSKAKNDAATIASLEAKLQHSAKMHEHDKKLITSLRNKLNESVDRRNVLTESVSSKDVTISKLNESLSSINEDILALKNNHKKMVENLNSEISTLKQESEAKHSQYSAKLAKCNKMVESYRNVAARAVDKYINCKATQLGISAAEIKNKLSESYSFDEIDSVCEKLRSYKLNMSKLPFSVNKDIQKVTLKEDTQTQRFTNPDDVVDKNLFNLI